MSSLSTYLDNGRKSDLTQDPDYGPPRFAHTYCAQCAADVGPGNAGLSSCLQHLRTIRPLPRKVGATPGLKYLTYHSDLLGVYLRVGLDIDNEDMHYQFGTLLAGVTLVEVWLGECDLSIHLEQTTANIIEAEAREALGKRQ